MNKGIVLKISLLLAGVMVLAFLVCSCSLLPGGDSGSTAAEASESTQKPTGSEQPAESSTPAASTAPAECIHSYGTWSTVKQQTCTEPGERQRVCSKCGNIDTFILPAKTHTVVIDEGVAPTCTTSGLSRGSHCAVCGAVIEEQKVIDAWGHQYVEDDGYPASCEEVGKTGGRHCSICGQIFEEQQTIPALGHDPVDSDDVEPTCEEPGWTGGTHCARCGKVLEAPTKSAEPLGHDVVEDDPVEPTCAAPGRTAGSHCARCGKWIKEPTEIAALPHTPVVDPAYDPECEKEGRGEGTHCAVCGEVIVPQKVIPALGHIYENGFCTRCGAEKPKNLPITGITLDIDQLHMEVGEQIQLTATLLPDGAIKNRIEWINEGKEYYTVTQDGLITAISPGKTTMTVYVEDDSSGEHRTFTKTCFIEITKDGGMGDYVPVTGIKVEKDHYTLHIGETVKLEYTILPENATDKRIDIINEPGEDGTRTYLSIDKAAGTVTALKAGEAKVTLYTEDSGKTKSVWFTILPDDE